MDLIRKLRQTVLAGQCTDCADLCNLDHCSATPDDCSVSPDDCSVRICSLCSSQGLQNITFATSMDHVELPEGLSSSTYGANFVQIFSFLDEVNRFKPRSVIAFKVSRHQAAVGTTPQLRKAFSFWNLPFILPFQAFPFWTSPPLPSSSAF